MRVAERPIKMLCPIFFGAFALVCLASLPAQAEEKAWEEKFSSDTGNYVVRVEPRKVEVKRVEPGPGAPPYMRLRILRPNDRPLEIRLKTIAAPNDPTRYQGKLDRWSQSNIGLELEISFDKKTWRRLGKTLKVFP